MAVVHYFFEEPQFTGYTKGELFGFTEFLCKIQYLITMKNRKIFHVLIELIITNKHI